MAGRASKQKGYAFEKELVDQAKAAGLEALRAWGSNGRALGEADTVDLLVAGYRVQAKRKKKLATYLAPPEGSDVQVFRADREDALVVLPWVLFLDILCSTGPRPDVRTVCQSPPS